MNAIADRVRAGDRDRYLATLYAPAALRPALFALWALDLQLGAVVTGATDAMVAQIKLAWWREALERLDHAPPPPEPLLSEIAATLLPMGVSGAELAAIEGDWLGVLEDDATFGEGHVMAIAAKILCQDGERALRILVGLRLLAGRDQRRAATGLPREQPGSLTRQLILLRAVALGR